MILSSIMCPVTPVRKEYFIDKNDNQLVDKFVVLYIPIQYRGNVKISDSKHLTKVAYTVGIQDVAVPIQTSLD